MNDEEKQRREKEQTTLYHTGENAANLVKLDAEDLKEIEENQQEEDAVEEDEDDGDEDDPDEDLDF